MRVLLIGSGGREHALGWALHRSSSVTTLVSAPGNPGLSALGECLPITVDQSEALFEAARSGNFDLVVVGPEVPLVEGLADRLRDAGIPVFGPGSDGAQLEGSKAWAKEFMTRHKIPTAASRTVTSLEEATRELRAPIVVKASGLAAGKGVTVAESLEEAEAALEACFENDRFGDSGHTVVLEEKLTGEEVSLFVITDGKQYACLPSSQDHKRAFDGDEGPNTGGMGAYSPAPCLSAVMLERVEEEIVQPTLNGLSKEGIDYRGLLYVGLMLTPEGPKVIEYNVRFGDPETQAVLPSIEQDWGLLFLSIAKAAFNPSDLKAPSAGASVCIVAATENYPESSDKGLVIEGIEEAEATGALVFHAGTAMKHGELVTAGGRVLNVVGRGATLKEALDVSYTALDRVRFSGMRFRKDIGFRALS
ncbi:MAG: phosphoribosylamine--glycine ligase [Candidatus Eisenbacteria bacterium]|uniref:Phosphoribosylamine--glycine ligase n=1 Tax=Eiseniibacteriota bacterium TaxID=2212470 RepID=A0A7Y2H377_UNCEI|nr:phosphoribosylamine--glycine ligase [Candidatus Eisenbacteria bacterium]